MPCFRCLRFLYWNRFNVLWQSNQEIHPFDTYFFNYLFCGWGCYTSRTVNLTFFSTPELCTSAQWQILNCVHKEQIMIETNPKNLKENTPAEKVCWSRLWNRSEFASLVLFAGYRLMVLAGGIIPSSQGSGASAHSCLESALTSRTPTSYPTLKVSSLWRGRKTDSSEKFCSLREFSSIRGCFKWQLALLAVLSLRASLSVACIYLHT